MSRSAKNHTTRKQPTPSSERRQDAATARMTSRNWLLLCLSFAGLFISVAAGVAEHVKWLELLCSSFASGCREASEFSFFGLPVWGWGIAYYIVLAASIYRFPKGVPWLVSSAAGFEITLIWIALSSKLYCIFCMGNFLIVLVLFVLSFDKRRFWQITTAGLLFFVISILLVPRQNTLSVSADASRGLPNIAAKVAGTVITEEELETTIASRLYELEKQIYQTKQQRLDQMITEKILEKEAARRNITSKQLVDEFLLSHRVQVSEEEVNRYLTENRNRLSNSRGSMKDLRTRIKTYLERRKSYEEVMQYAKSLRNKYDVVVYLKEPPPPHVKVDVTGNQAIGPADAPVKIVEFSDYQCPVCRKSHQVVQKIREEYRGRIQWIFKDYPLKMHEHAEMSAEAARCAGDQGKFWEYQDALFAAEDDGLTSSRFQEYAVTLGLDAGQFRQCLESGKYKKAVEQDILEGKRVGVNSTPSFMINGKLISGFMDLKRFEGIIDEELHRVPGGAGISGSRADNG